MININLVPEKVRAGEALKVIMLLGSLSLVIPLLFWSWRFVVAKAELSGVEEEIDKVVAELNSPQLKQVVEEVEQFTRDRANLDSKRSLVDALRKKQVVLVRMLDAIPDLLPRRAWLTKMEVKEEKGVRRVAMEGMSEVPEAVADFYVGLEAHPVVKKLAMDDPPKTDRYRGVDIVKFKLSFEVEETL